MKIATVTIGYGDGLERRLNQTDFLVSVKGVPTPFVGRMSMDRLVIDVSQVEDIKEGDVVEFLMGTMMSMIWPERLIPYPMKS